MFYDGDSAFWFEQELIQKSIKDSKCLNKNYQIYSGKKIFSHCLNSNSDKARAKISAKLKGRKQSADHIEKNRVRQVGKSKTEAHKQALRVPKTLTVALKEAHKKMSETVLCNRRISCIFCKKETALNYFSRHVNCK